MSSRTPTDSQVEAFRRDAQLVADSMSQDKDAQRRLAERLKCVPRMLTAKNASLGHPLDSADLEDLAQETILAIWNKRGTYNGYSTLETWVFPFCYHFLMNRVRRIRNRPRSVGIEDADIVEAPRGDDYGFVHAALDELGPPDNVIMRLKHFEQLSFTRIGEVLGISPNTAKSRYYRGASRLRAMLHGSESPEQP